MTAGLERALDGLTAYGPLLPIYGPANRQPDGTWERCGCGSLTCTNQGKHPRRDYAPEGVDSAGVDPTWIATWWQPGRNVAMAAGHGVVFIDADSPEAVAWVEALDPQHIGKFRTGRGLQWMVPVNGEDDTRPIAERDFVGVRGLGNYSVIPPSNHFSGRQYEWALDPRDGILAGTAPYSQVRAAILARGGVATDPGVEDHDRFAMPEAIRVGERDNTLTSVAGWLRSVMLDREAARDHMRHVVFPRVEQPLGDEFTLEAALAKVDWAWEHYPAPGAGLDPDLLRWATSSDRGVTDRERTVEQAVERLEITELARERVEEKRLLAGWVPPAPIGIGTLAATELEEEPFHVAELWPTQSNVLLAAPLKWGKSKLTRTVCECTLLREPFLGRDVLAPFKHILVVDMELTKAQAISYWKGTRLTDAQLTMWPLRGRAETFGIRSKVVRRELAKLIRDTGADAIVIDPIGPVLDVNGWDESSNTDFGAFANAVAELQHDAGELAGFLTHHTGHTAERGRGASKQAGWADAVWTGTYLNGNDDAHKPGARRFLSAVGRDVELEEVEVVFNSAIGRVEKSLIGASRSVLRSAERIERTRETQLDRVLAALRAVPAGFKNHEELLKATREHSDDSKAVRRDALHDIRATLVGTGVIANTATGWFPINSEPGTDTSEGAT